jgi:hypothetical protein
MFAINWIPSERRFPPEILQIHLYNLPGKKIFPPIGACSGKLELDNGGCPSRFLSIPIKHKTIHSIGWGQNIYEGIEHDIGSFQG